MDSMINKNLKDVAFSFNFETGCYSVNVPGFEIKDARVVIRTSEEEFADFEWTEEKNTADELCLKSEFHLGTVSLAIKLDDNARSGGQVAVSLSAEMDIPVKKLFLVPAEISYLECNHILVQGRKAGGCSALKLPLEDNEAFESFFQTMISKSGHTLQVAFPMLQDYEAKVTGITDGEGIKKFSAETFISPCQAAEVKAEKIVFRSSKDGHGLMFDWADENIEEEKELENPVKGWNTWDYYRWTITEDEVLENAEFIASDPVLSKHVKRIIVDDGWQYCYGEWDANPLFPSGMKALADRLAGMGFEPGLWIAPTIVEPHSRIAQLHTDMLALGESGYPCLAYECCKRLGFVLDPTREKTRKWLFDLFNRYTEAGYKYFKLDFLWQTLKAPYFYDKTVSRGQITREIMRPIYQAANGKASILGCNFNFEGGSAYVDYVRVSGDIHSKWKSIKTNVPSVASRFWANGKLWWNDPDFALCRGAETSDDPDLEKLRPVLVYVSPDMPESAEAHEKNESLVNITYEESKILLSIAILSGGSLNLSDKMTLLNEKGLDLARRTVSAEPGKAALPLDLFASREPSYWLQELNSGGHRVLMVNWDETEREMMLDLNKYNVSYSTCKDFWTDENYPVKGNRIEAALKPHTCRLLNFSTRG